MFSKLFAQSGLSLDRLRVLVEVGASGSIARASDGDAVRQSQYSRQIKELEDFFQIRLLERHGKGVRLTASGRELARISRFFLLGLSNFQRGCLDERQTFRIGASATVIHQLMLPVVSEYQATKRGPGFVLENVEPDEIERRLHDLRLDFGVVTAQALSRPLQLMAIGSWWLRLWVPRGLFRTELTAVQALTQGEMPLVVPREIRPVELTALKKCRPQLTCESFLEAAKAAELGGLATFLPDYLRPAESMRVDLPLTGQAVFTYHLAWNPRLIRLNVHAARTRAELVECLRAKMANLERF